MGAPISALTPTSSSTDIASYAAADLPPGLTINAASGAISGTPDTAKTSTQGATVTATDNADNATAASVTFPAVAKGRQDLSGFKYSAQRGRPERHAADLERAHGGAGHAELHGRAGRGVHGRPAAAAR